MLKDRPTSQWQPSDHLTGTLEDAHRLLAGASSAVVLTGAGVSTESGVPDYRGPNSMRATPMLYSEFTGHPTARQRYWARNYQGWATMSRAEPNTAHHAIAKWEHSGRPCPLVGVITQNVDGLHEAAGSRRLVTLHGRSADVICLRCGRMVSRADLQHRLAEANPQVRIKPFLEHAELRPDADAEVADWRGFQVPDCEFCGGILKPDVVFFGETVPRHRVATAMAWCEGAGALLVAGSSLTVMSGLRFARTMAKQGKPVIVINHGATRADELASVRLDLNVGRALATLVAEV
ncbi:MAG: Sir2 family NAD-dependent protein deacetylase [Brooklawnia sp.]|uniref:Sir2 family NAD-dependent protein deacetylase n=1 Tax=Brooklawnia sp. TaxID=2699740 RepID=UPI003C742F67